MINLFLSVIYNLINLLTEINWSDSSAGSKYIFEVVNKENLSFLPSLSSRAVSLTFGPIAQLDRAFAF